MKTPTALILRYLPVFILFLLATGVSYLYADVWSDPAGAPTGNNASAPVNVSSTTQSKAGNFTANVLNANIVAAAQQFCLPGIGPWGGCISAWPSGGSSSSSGSSIPQINYDASTTVVVSNGECGETGPYSVAGANTAGAKAVHLPFSGRGNWYMSCPTGYVAIGIIQVDSCGGGNQNFGVACAPFK